MLRTIHSVVERALLYVVLALSLLLVGCGDKTPPQMVYLTFKKDGSHFSGTLVRKEPNSLTVTGTAGDTHTFLLSELSDIKYVEPEPPAGSAPTPASNSNAPAKLGNQPVQPASPAGQTSAPVSSASIGSDAMIPAGTDFPIRTVGFLDSCCVPIGALALGTVDDDIKGAGGKVVIPRNSSIVFELMDNRKIDGQITMTFQLASVDFEGRHYLISSAKGGHETGAVATLTGAKENTPQAKLRGLQAHLDDQSLMKFKAMTPILVRLPQ